MKRTKYGDLTPVNQLLLEEPELSLYLRPDGGKKITRASVARVVKLIETGELIKDYPATIADAAYIPAVLCHIGLPRSKTNERVYERTYTSPNFSASLRVEAGALWTGTGWEDQIVPYGIKPRHIITNLFTTAKRTGDRFIDVGRSTREYMKRIGLDDQGSQRKSFQQQMRAVAACSMKMGRTYGDGRVRTTKGELIKDFQAWVTHDDSQQKALWPGTMELSAEMFNDALELVPVDERAAYSLDGALEADIYYWLTQRLCRINDPRGQFITWQALTDQFAGSSYKRPRKFRDNFITSARQVRLVYPDAKLDNTTGGLWLYHSKPPIPKVSIRVPRLVK
jgi:hypothetical protein